jgi:signal transduction histidine kinase/DNA-binding NarL/FixJ family response regulator
MSGGLPIEPYPLALFASALVSLLLSARAAMGTRKALARSFAFFEFAVFLWSFFRLGLWVVVSPSGRFEALELQYLGIAFAPGAFYLIARALAGKPVTDLVFALTLIPGAATIALVFTNGSHRLFWPEEGLSALPLNPRGGPAFWGFVGYAFLQVAVSLAIIARIALRAKGRFGRSMKLLFWLSVLPSATNAAFVFLFIGRTAYDPTPLAFAVTGGFLVLELGHFDIFDAVPYAKGVLLETLDSPIIVVDAAGLIDGANEYAKRVLPAIDILEGRPIAELVPAISGTEADGEVRVWSLGGTEYAIDCHLVKRGRGSRRGRMYFFRNVSGEMRARREAEGAQAKADAANAAKSSFMAVVSHEMRNPLNAIIGLADLDLRAFPPPGIREDLEMILSSGTALLGLVNDLLDVSKIEAGKMELERAAFDLHEKAVTVLKAFRPAIEKKGIFLDIVIEEGTPRYVKGDPLRYGQILMNFVSNAIKFTEKGAVAVQLSALPAGAGPPDGDPRNLYVLTSVRDTGIGISAGQMPRLFQDFSQVDASVGRRFGGTGLGLSISKRLVELFGGDVSVKSTEGMGSTFSFTARFEPAEPPAPAISLASPDGSPVARPLRVLVVDDDPINGAVARRYLERLGHDSEIANSGRQALAMLARAELDLVLLDLGLPDMDGFEACRLIRAERSPGLGEGPAIAAMTARAETSLRGSCLAAGMVDCLVKPLDPLALERLLARLGSEARKIAPHAAASVLESALPDVARLEAMDASQPSVEPGTPLLEGGDLLGRFNGEASFIRELLLIFIGEAAGRRDDFIAAREAADLDRLQRLAHALKGSALTLCADPLGASAAALEAACMAWRRAGSKAPEFAAAAAAEVEGLLALLAGTADAARRILETDDRMRDQ